MLECWKYAYCVPLGGQNVLVSESYVNAYKIYSNSRKSSQVNVETLYPPWREVNDFLNKKHLFTNKETIHALDAKNRQIDFSLNPSQKTLPVFRVFNGKQVNGLRPYTRDNCWVETQQLGRSSKGLTNVILACFSCTLK